MRVSLPTFLILLTAMPPVLLAQQTIPRQALTATQQLGRRLFDRECAVCHTQPLITAKPYASPLYRDLVEGKEEAVRQTVRKGLPGLMPGFEYGLKPAEIDAILDYLKTVPKPSPSNLAGQASESGRPTD